MATATELQVLLSRLTAEADRDLAVVWSQATVDDVADALRDMLPALVGDYGDAASVVAAEWYDEYRADLNIGGSFRAEVAPTVDLGADALAGWGIARATENWDSALSLISGGMQRRIVNVARSTITTSTSLDPQAEGWQRIARGTGCGFCQMLAGRGAVYKSSGVADFASHDHCHCQAVPAFGGRPRPVKPYAPTSRNITDADRARTREWIASNL